MHFTGQQDTVVSGSELIEFESGEFYATQAANTVAHYFQHFANLTVAAFAQGNFHQGVGFGLCFNGDAARGRFDPFLAVFFGNENALLKNFDDFRREFSTTARMISLLHAVRRVG